MFEFYRLKGAIIRFYIHKIGTFCGRVKTRPYEWMTITSPKPDGVWLLKEPDKFLFISD